jgi:teichuronic acid biosynthesis glycosyltransferase TuaC
MVPEAEALVEQYAPPRPMRALIVTNMYPTPTHPARGSFVRDQVDALRRISEIEVEVFSFEPGSVGAYGRAAQDLRHRYRGERFDVVHAHFGLTAWPAIAARGRSRAVTLHGTDLHHRRSRAITLAALRHLDLVAAVSEPLSLEIPGWATRAGVAVLPCGVDVDRFRPIPRADARAAVGLDPDRPYLLFAADPRRHEKRYDRARAVAGNARLLTLVDVEPRNVPLWVNAVNAVLAPSDREGFGLAVLEALACDVPVLATPVGIAPAVLDRVAGAHCGAFELGAWRAALAPHLRSPDPRVDGRARAEPFSTDRMAQRLVEAWQRLG